MSVMASTADIQVKASRGSTTQELHKDALREKRKACVKEINKMRSGGFCQISMTTWFLQNDSTALVCILLVVEAILLLFF